MSCYWSPPVVLDPHQGLRHRFFVVRDDLLPGGTKQRAAIPFLESLAQEGVDEFVYASPFCGFAQLALSIAAAAVGKRAYLFCAVEDSTGNLHPYSQAAERWGAQVTPCATLAAATERAQHYAMEGVSGGAAELIRSAILNRKRYLIPLGFDCPTFRVHLQKSVAVEWERLLNALGAAPRQIWVPVGSGTLATVCRAVIPEETRLCCVNVRVLPDHDPRLLAVSALPNTRFVTVPEVFEEPCEVPPPLPSNLFYDAKLWRFVQSEAEDGDVWWNVAGEVPVGFHPGAISGFRH